MTITDEDVARAQAAADELLALEAKGADEAGTETKKRRKKKKKSAAKAGDGNSPANVDDQANTKDRMSSDDDDAPPAPAPFAPTPSSIAPCIADALTPDAPEAPVEAREAEALPHDDLPPGWQCHLDASTGKPYYSFGSDATSVRWDRPPSHKEKAGTERARGAVAAPPSRHDSATSPGPLVTGGGRADADERAREGSEALSAQSRSQAAVAEARVAAWEELAGASEARATSEARRADAAEARAGAAEARAATEAARADGEARRADAAERAHEDSEAISAQLGIQAAAAEARAAAAEARADAAERALRRAEAEPEGLEALDEDALRELDYRIRASGERVFRAINAARDRDRARERDARMCVICMEREKAYAPQCRHMCICAECARDPPDACPMCRVSVPAGGWKQVFV